MTKHLSRLKIKCVSDVEKRDIKGKKRKEKKGHYAKENTDINMAVNVCAFK
jgi:hypothetical protein